MSDGLITKHTAAWRIWHLQYSVVVPAIAGYSAEYLRKNALNITGDKKLDKMKLSQTEVVRQTVAGMILILNEGHTVGLRNYKDCVQIYHDIQRHFQDWYDLALAGANVNTFPPLEELRALEEFAVDIHQTAVRLEPKVSNQSNIFDAIIAMNMRRNPLATRRYLNKRITTEKNAIRAYNSIVDDIEEYVLSED